VVTVGAVRTPGKRERADKHEDASLPGGNIASSADLKTGDRLVYPKQGVYRVTGLEQKDIAGQRLEFVKMTREEDGASVLVPLGKVPTIGLRRVATADDIEGVFHYLGASYDDPELDWKVRHRDNVERLIAGGVLGVAEVVKGLHTLARMRPLPAKERELYDSSRHLLVNEISVSLSVPETIAEDYVDFALMPPAGVKLPLRTPPTPVELKGPPWKRKKPVAADDDDLGLAELGIDLGALEGVAGAAEGDESEGGEAEGAAPAEEGAEEAAAVPAPAPAPAKVAGKAPAGKGAPARAPAAKGAPPKKAPPPPPPPPKKGAARAAPAKKPGPKPSSKAPPRAPARSPAKPARTVAKAKKSAKPARKPAASKPGAPRKGAKPAKGKKK
jgi:RNA polymerase-interacting CarD/CdnL/TRCF family regulator